MNYSFLPSQHEALCKILAIIALADGKVDEGEKRAINGFITENDIDRELYEKAFLFIEDMFRVKSENEIFDYFVQTITDAKIDGNYFMGEVEYICGKISLSPDGSFSSLELKIMNYFDPSESTGYNLFYTE